MSTVLSAALALAKRGFPVHPLYEPTPGAPKGAREDGAPTGGCACQDAACESAGKHPRLHAWQKAATTDAGQVRHWWQTWPTANIAIATGHPLPTGGFLAVLDIDPRSDGDASLEELEAMYSPLPETVQVRTGGGGWHLYFSTPEPVPSRKGLAPGVDLKARGGYVVAPPSLHPQGRYEWDR